MKKAIVLLCLVCVHILSYAQDLFKDNAMPVVANENYSISILPHACGTIIMVELNNANTGNVIVELFSFSGKPLQKKIIYQEGQYTFFNMSELDSDEYVVRIQTPTAIKVNRIVVMK
ncbi:MAG: T9SS type A sorting domain-containing protein [Flavobacteriales bacterium]